MVKGLLDAYHAKTVSFDDKVNAIRKEVREHIEAAEALEEKAQETRKAAEALESRIKLIPMPDWKEDIIVPLANELAKRTGKQAMLSGPCGLGGRTTICLVDDAETTWYEQDRLELTLQPGFENGSLFFAYATGETVEKFKPGTIGDINGLSNITARLPDSVEEILALLKFWPAVDLTKEG